MRPDRALCKPVHMAQGAKQPVTEYVMYVNLALCCVICTVWFVDSQCFCFRSCVGDAMGNSCPECGVPSHVKDVVTNRQLESAVIWCQKLSWLLLKESTSKQQGNNAHGKVLVYCHDSMNNKIH